MYVVEAFITSNKIDRHKYMSLFISYHYYVYGIRLFSSIKFLFVGGHFIVNITLSSNASNVSFEYLQYYLNKREKACKASVNE